MARNKGNVQVLPSRLPAGVLQDLQAAVGKKDPGVIAKRAAYDRMVDQISAADTVLRAANRRRKAADHINFSKLLNTRIKLTRDAMGTNKEEAKNSASYARKILAELATSEALAPAKIAPSNVAKIAALDAETAQIANAIIDGAADHIRRVAEAASAAVAGPARDVAAERYVARAIATAFARRLDAIGEDVDAESAATAAERGFNLDEEGGLSEIAQLLAGTPKASWAHVLAGLARERADIGEVRRVLGLRTPTSVVELQPEDFTEPVAADLRTVNEEADESAVKEAEEESVNAMASGAGAEQTGEGLAREVPAALLHELAAELPAGLAARAARAIARSRAKTADEMRAVAVAELPDKEKELAKVTFEHTQRGAGLDLAALEKMAAFIRSGYRKGPYQEELERQLDMARPNIATTKTGQLGSDVDPEAVAADLQAIEQIGAQRAATAEAEAFEKTIPTSQKKAAGMLIDLVQRGRWSEVRKLIGALIKKKILTEEQVGQILEAMEVTEEELHSADKK